MTSAVPVPKYHQVYLVLREQLHEGRFSEGVPGEIALMHEFGVARVTVRKALGLLAAERLIRRTPGRGTVPLPASVARRDTLRGDSQRAGSLFENPIGLQLHTQIKVLSVRTVPCPASVAEALEMVEGEPVQKAQRVRLIREGPLSHITTHVPQALAPFGRRDLARKPILMLLEQSGVQVGRATQVISARLADAEVARHLDVAVGSALLSVQRLVLDRRDRPVLWLLGLYRPDRYAYRTELSRVGRIDARVWVNKLPSPAAVDPRSSRPQ
ncbi:MAG: GntR family transcriptional regulator [Burkholderiaceae bacterium]|nr:GntR family transcriptional regulator [Burkholderiaceae bacterium]